jgi:hypothetical protein
VVIGQQLHAMLHRMLWRYGRKIGGHDVAHLCVGGSPAFRITLRE